MRGAFVGGLRKGSPLQNNLENQYNHNHHQQTNATPTRPSIAKSTLRSSLQQRDSNVMMRVPPNKPLRAKSGNSNMPAYDKQNGTTRPLMPTLSAAAAKSMNKVPLTPRVAASNPPSVATPLSRRNPRADTGAKEGGPPPVPPFLNNNITPRSGSRKSRVNSTNTTPTGTPNGAPGSLSTNESFRMAPDLHTYTMGINGVDRDIPKRATVSFSPAMSDTGYSRAPSPNTTNGDSKFFFASEAKTGQPPARPSLESKNSSSTFFYASGERIPPPPHSSSASAAGSTSGEESKPPRFFHANGTPDLQLAASPHFPPPRPSSVLSSSSRRASPRRGTISPAGPLSPQQRPSSPLKPTTQYASLSSGRHSPLPSPVLPRQPPTGKGNSAGGIVSARRASVEAQRVIHHGRSQSGSSATDARPFHVRKVSGGSSFDLSAPSSPLSLVTNSISIIAPGEGAGDVVVNDGSSASQSPIKAGHSIEKMNELAAEARRERKVLDLEITNSSLEAINRTLEREMRKVTAELRRYRRLSRSGRFSIASTTVEESSATLTIDDMIGPVLSDMSEEEDEKEESEVSEEESPDEGTLSPDAMAEHDLKHRTRDENRLQLDLTNHQQLLIDSQKMNQSLKRCLGWSETMINEGKKALEYRVRITDVALGGRVLAPDEVEQEEDEEEENEGMSEFGAQMLRAARERAAGVEVVTWGSEGSVDRDSGIELDGSQREST